MSVTPNELAQLAITFPQEYAEQINAKSEKHRVAREDCSQEVSLIILEKGADFDPTKGTWPQFVFGHWEKRMRRQLGAHTYAVSLDRDDIAGEALRNEIENIIASSDDLDDEEALLSSDQSELRKFLLIAEFISGKSISDIAQYFRFSTRYTRQMLQQICEKKTIPKCFKIYLAEVCRSCPNSMGNMQNCQCIAKA